MELLLHRLLTFRPRFAHSSNHACQKFLIHFRTPSMFIRCKSSQTDPKLYVKNFKKGPSLQDFISQRLRDTVQEKGAGGASGQELDSDSLPPYLESRVTNGCGRQVYFETFGCQMNINDTEIAWSILKDAGYTRTTAVKEADVILTVTCAIRDNAEKKVWSRLNEFKHLKTRRKSSGLSPLKVGVLGCMAERLKETLLETDKTVDIVAGPDSYRDLPRLLSVTESGQAAVNVQLSLDETYADITPIRMSENSATAYVSIMRGCDNMCSFCIVPFTRGRERSRPISSILEEIRKLSYDGVKEVTLLGQNVNSYRDLNPSDVPSLQPPASSHSYNMSQGFTTIYKGKEGGRRFADLLHHVAQIDPEMRIRFTSPHPKDFPNELLQVIKSHDNVCKHIHLPVQSGSTAVLKRMRRGHSREAYLELVKEIKETIPGVALSSDFIAGFCGETESDHKDTLTLMDAVGYDMAYMFAYSMRKKTHAYHRMTDDVPAATKQRRLQEIVDAFYSSASKLKESRYIGTDQLVLVEGNSKKSDDNLVGRADSNVKVVFSNKPLPSDISCDDNNKTTAGAHYSRPKPGDYVRVKITEASAITLRGSPLFRTNIKRFHMN